MTDSALSTQPFLQAPARAPEAPFAALPFALAYSRYIQRLAQAREGWADRVHAAAGRPIDVAWLSARFAAVSYTHLTLPTKEDECRSRWSPYH